MDHGDYSILFFESTARDFLLGFFLVLPLLFRAAIKVCDYVIGAADHFAPYFQDELLGLLLERVRPGGLFAFVGRERGAWVGTRVAGLAMKGVDQETGEEIATWGEKAGGDKSRPERPRGRLLPVVALVERTGHPERQISASLSRVWLECV